METLVRLKELPETASIPVIILTSKDLGKEEIQKLQAYTMEILSKRTHTKESVLQQVREILLKQVSK